MSSSTTAATTKRAPAIDWGAFARVGALTVVVAIIANIIVFFLGNLLVAYDPQFLPLSNVVPAIIFTLLPAVVAVLIYAALLRFTRNPARIFMIIAAVVFVVMLIPDFVVVPTMPGATTGQTAILLLMHVAAAAAIVGILVSRTPSFTR